MKLVGDIINELIDSEKSLEAPLLKTKVLASRIKNESLLKWVNQELGGYKSEILPDYRISSASLSGSYLNGGSAIFRGQQISTAGLPQKIQDALNKVEFYNSIATIEALSKGDKSGLIEIIVPADFITLLERHIKVINPYFQLLELKKCTSLNSAIHILAVVRSKLLEFMLQLENEFGYITEIKDLQTKNERITTIMNSTIINNGDGNVSNTGANANISASISITKGDKQSLKKVLSENGIAEDDITELTEIIDVETPVNDNKTFGLQTNKWISKMIAKSLDGSWQIGLGAAGSILSEIILSYYGIK